MLFGQALRFGVLGRAALDFALRFGRLALLFGEQGRAALRLAFGGGHPLTLGLFGGGAFGRQALRPGGFVGAALRLAFGLGAPRVAATPPDHPAGQQAQRGCSQQPSHKFAHE